MTNLARARFGPVDESSNSVFDLILVRRAVEEAMGFGNQAISTDLPDFIAAGLNAIARSTRTVVGPL